MSEHKIHLQWKRSSSDFAYETYNRDHSISFEGGITIQGSSAPEFKGDSALANPEELLVAALSSCHMLTFLAVAAKSRLVVDSYTDHPVGTLEKNSEGQMVVTRTTLHPSIIFSGETPSAEKLEALHEKAHRNCFIANSVKTVVDWQ